VSYTPSAYTAYASRVVFEDAGNWNLVKWLSSEQRGFLLQKSAELGFVFVDLTAGLAAAQQSDDGAGLLYFQDNLHLTPRGHEIVAAALAQVVEKISENTARPGHGP
jgi:hypothetical protein